MSDLRRQLVRLAHAQPELRADILPLLAPKTAASNKKLIQLIKDTFPDAREPEEIATDLEYGIHDALGERAKRLLEQIEASDKPRRFEMSNDDWVSNSYQWDDSGGNEWWPSVEVEFPGQVRWTVNQQVNFNKAKATAIADIADMHRLDPKALVAVFKDRDVLRMVEDAWKGTVAGLESDSPKNEPLASEPHQKLGVVKAMYAAWWRNVQDTAHIEEDAPFIELPIDWTLQDDWKWTRTLEPTAKGFAVHWVATVKVRIEFEP